MKKLFIIAAMALVCGLQSNLYAGDTTYTYAKENGVLTKKTVVEEKFLDDTPDRLSAEDAAALRSGTSNSKLITTWESDVKVGFWPRVFNWLVPWRTKITWQYSYNSSTNKIEENIVSAGEPVIDGFALGMRLLLFLIVNGLCIGLIFSLGVSSFIHPGRSLAVFLILGCSVASIVIGTLIQYLPELNVLSFLLTEALVIGLGFISRTMYVRRRDRLQSNTV